MQLILFIYVLLFIFNLVKNLCSTQGFYLFNKHIYLLFSFDLLLLLHVFYIYVITKKGIKA
jgi:hypothetical protein